MRVLLLGAGGMLAQDMIATAASCRELVPMTHADLDLTDTGALERVLDDLRVEWVVNAAGYTDVDRAEREEAAAFAVNDVAVGNLGRLCAARDIRVVHFSTDYVFDGCQERSYREDDTPAPLNAYGRSKYAGEQRLLHSGAKALVVRTQWLFGLVGRSFPRTMLERARAELPTRVVADQCGRPSFCEDVARATWLLMRRRANGVFHVANSGQATWFDVALHIFARRGVAHLLTPCASDDMARPARRPRNSVLATEKFESELSSFLPDWRSSLDQFLELIGRGDPSLSTDSPDGGR